MVLLAGAKRVTRCGAAQTGRGEDERLKAKDRGNRPGRHRKEGKRIYVIFVYDVHVDRVARVLKTARRYLTWVQNSVLEGELTAAQFERLQDELKKIIDPEEDALLFYVLRSAGDVRRRKLGREKAETAFFL
ncbi:MAG: CRISPR-associated protein Cas2 [Hydrogenibacillus schlegelii]|uniref:CRISPR-associated endoribonuclease Cas2 n=2 Tax=Hydrogenibacillus schlegelii TaxID=1484 RepID=A0A2T5G4E5_HYDSH|nr:MAG: CRISPR-associated protein Cas2 [Hydrogenibacillus schlegelii]